MKIVKEGKIKPEEFNKTCYKCRTQFIYKSEDVKPDRDGSYVKCPKCDAFLAHSPK